MLSDLQDRVARIVAELPEARGFVLAGGAALVVHGLTERATNDLDFFTTSRDDIHALRQAIETALAAEGMTDGVVIAAETFVRLKVSVGGAETHVDLAWDARMLPAGAPTSSLLAEIPWGVPGRVTRASLYEFDRSLVARQPPTTFPSPSMAVASSARSAVHAGWTWPPTSKRRTPPGRRCGSSKATPWS